MDFLMLSQVPVWPEELMERADEALREGPITPEAATTFWSQYGGWAIFGAVVIGLVSLMLLMIAGRYRRERRAGESATDPLFEDQYAVPEMDEDTVSPFAEVVIEDAPTVGFAEAEETVRAIDEANGVEDEDEIETVVPRFEDEQDERANVVPLRAQEPEPKYEEAPGFNQQTNLQDDTVEAEAPRYAFATGRAATTESNMSHNGDNDGRSGGRNDSFVATSSASMRDDDDGRPFVAPFIREDIERSERRQADRIDSLRDDFSRQFATLKNEQSSRLDLVISAIDRKLESLDQRHATMAGDPERHAEVGRGVQTVGEQVDRLSSAIDGQGQRIRAITQILETRFAEVGRVYDEVKTVHEDVKALGSDVGKTAGTMGEIRTDLDEVKEHVGRLERAILDRAAQDSATTVRLTDVIRGTLPDGSYAFGATLANGETADCLVSFTGLREKVAIDAGFPMEAFHELPSRDAVRRNLPQAKAAEDAFRRAILRSILEAGDRCISPTETADSCLLFLPSEAAYTILHDRFPDLVRDSQRARVWLVSPSTLMGTLNLIRNLLPDTDELERRTLKASEAQAKRDEESRLRDEVAALRRRASGLAEELDRTRGTLSELIQSTEKIGGAAGMSDSADEEVDGLEPDIDDEGIIDSLRFEGTPDWTSPLSGRTERRRDGDDGGDDDHLDPLR